LDEDDCWEKFFFFFRKLNEDLGKSIVEKGKMKGRDRIKQVGGKRKGEEIKKKLEKGRV
jgi:hypothetical protein